MSVQDWAPFISAGAASLAAVLAGTNLYLAGHREHLLWTKSALEQALVDFLTAHYDHLDACRDIAQPAMGRAKKTSDGDALQKAREADSVMMSCITRFRVLVSDDLAKTALNLR